MPPSEMIGPLQEYDTLRQELLEAKRYVFERPLAILALAVAAIQFFDKPQAVVIPVAVAFVTLFNLWFTVNRLQSAARIAAYIQLVLEGPERYQWVGWEKSLRAYRIWLQELSKPVDSLAFWDIRRFFVQQRTQAHQYVDYMLDNRAVPDGLMYYPAIYIFHAVLIGLAVIGSLAGVWFSDHKWVSGFFCLCTLAVGVFSLKYFIMWTPCRLSAAVERNRVIFEAALFHD